MTVRQASDGTAKTKSQVTSAFSSSTVTQYTVDQDYTADFQLEGQSAFEAGRSLLWHKGQVILQADIDAAFATATFTSITPTGGTTAGGTVTTIKGTNLGGATGVTFGGTAGTAFSVVDEQTIKVTTPAKTAGAVNVVIQDDSGNVTATNAYTYS